MSTTDMTATEMFESLTGYEEIAIAKAFGTRVLELAETDKMSLGRSLAFVHYKRSGQKDSEAKQSAMGMTIREVQDYFADEPDDLDPDDPDTDTGKGSSPDEGRHEPSPSGA